MGAAASQVSRCCHHDLERQDVRPNTPSLGPNLRPGPIAWSVHLVGLWDAGESFGVFDPAKFGLQFPSVVATADPNEPSRGAPLLLPVRSMLLPLAARPSHSRFTRRRETVRENCAS